MIYARGLNGSMCWGRAQGTTCAQHTEAKKMLASSTKCSISGGLLLGILRVLDQLLLVTSQVCRFCSIVPHFSEVSAKDCDRNNRCYESVWRNTSVMQPNLLSAPKGIDFPPAISWFCAAISVLSWPGFTNRFVGWGDEHPLFDQPSSAINWCENQARIRSWVWVNIS